jgi:UDP-N-acetylglucosamine 2-epimerase (non-hydrolysing)
MPQHQKEVLGDSFVSLERQEAIETGFARLVGTDKNNILEALNQAVEEKEKLPSVSPFGDGTAATKTVEIIKKDLA